MVFGVWQAFRVDKAVLKNDPSCASLAVINYSFMLGATQ